MKRFLHTASLAIAALVALMPAGALALTPSDQPPSEDDSTILTIVDGRDRHEVSLQDIEGAHTLHDVELRHFEGLEGVFTGVRLEAFVEAKGLDEARRIRFIAADEYTIFLTPDEIADKGFLLVTRFDGDHLATDNLGPLLLVVPDEEEAVLAGEVTPTHWMWSIIELRAL